MSRALRLIWRAALSILKGFDTTGVNDLCRDDHERL